MQRFQELVPNAFFRDCQAEIESTFLGPNVLRVCGCECPYSIKMILVNNKVHAPAL